MSQLDERIYFNERIYFDKKEDALVFKSGKRKDEKQMNHNVYKPIIYLGILGCVVFLMFMLTGCSSSEPIVVDTDEYVAIPNSVKNTDNTFSLQDARRLHTFYRYAR